MAKLVINPTSASKKEIPIVARVVSIGRDPSNDLVLSDSMVSRRHAILEHRENHYVLRDNGSSNGTLVNGDRVSEEKTLRDGDLVSIGSARLLFRLDDGPEQGLGDLSLPSGPGLADGSSHPSLSVGFERRCPSCGKVTLSEDRFCRGCGAGLAGRSARTECPSCGKEVLLPADFCGNCGKALSAGLAADLSTRPHRREDLQPSSARAGGAERPKEPPPAPSPAVRRAKPARPVEENASFGARLVAGLVDVMILGIPVLVVGLVWATLSMDSVAGSRGESWSGLPAAASGLLLFAFFYFFLFWAFRGATPGQSLLGVVVRTSSGASPIGPVRAAMRIFAGFLALLPLGLGFLWIAFSEERVGWHDRLSGTRVTRST